MFIDTLVMMLSSRPANSGQDLGTHAAQESRIRTGQAQIARVPAPCSHREKNRHHDANSLFADPGGRVHVDARGRGGRRRAGSGKGATGASSILRAAACSACPQLVKVSPARDMSSGRYMQFSSVLRCLGGKRSRISSSPGDESVASATRVRWWQLGQHGPPLSC